jgi:hypothetical protein
MVSRAAQETRGEVTPSRDRDALDSIFHAGFARPPTISVLAGRRSPSTALQPSRAAAGSGVRPQLMGYEIPRLMLA